MKIIDYDGRAIYIETPEEAAEREEEEAWEEALLRGDLGPLPADDHWWWDPIGY